MLTLFRGMQECFREYPEIYGAELADEAAADETMADAGVPPLEDSQKLRDEHDTDAESLKHATRDASAPVKPPTKDPIPTKWDDATAANEEVQSGQVENKVPENKE